jgi:hypothetical protein
MSEPVEIILNYKRQLIRLYCGQCGDPKDIIIDIDNDKNIHVIIADSVEDTECPKEIQLTPVEIIV